MDAFAEELNKRLVEAPSTLEQHKKTIKFVTFFKNPKISNFPRYLLMLEAHADPGLECLQAQHTWLETQLWSLQTRLNDVARQRSERQSPRRREDDEHRLSDASTDLPERYEFVENVLELLLER